MDMGKQSLTGCRQGLDTATLKLVGDLHRGLFDGKDANSQVHSCLDRGSEPRLGVEGGEGSGASN